jgi:hypothetical protein
MRKLQLLEQNCKNIISANLFYSFFSGFFWGKRDDINWIQNWCFKIRPCKSCYLILVKFWERKIPNHALYIKIKFLCLLKWPQ